MNKSVLKKIAYELNIELRGNIIEFIFAICNQFLKIHGITGKENWLKNFLNYNGDISKKVEKIINKYNNEFENLECIGWLYQNFIADEKERVAQRYIKNNS